LNFDLELQIHIGFGSNLFWFTFTIHTVYIKFGSNLFIVKLVSMITWFYTYNLDL